MHVMHLAPGTCVTAAKTVDNTKNIRGNREEDKGHGELGYAKCFGGFSQQEDFTKFN